MIIGELKKLNLPDTPGVYFFKKGKEILYIGKATSLADRVKSYFNKDLIVSRGLRVVQMVELTDNLEWQTTDSVLEALVLEATLIKKHQPFYNVKEKDDKSWWYVGLTAEEYPRVLMIRGKQLVDGTYDPDEFSDTFGPFTSGAELREAMKIIRKLFPFRDKCQPGSGKPCFNAQLGLCPGVCSGLPAKEYKKQIKTIKLFFQGRKQEIIKNFEKEMQRAVKSEDFETAARLRNKIFALNHIRDIALIKSPVIEGANQKTVFRIEAYDIAHLSGKNTVGAMVVMEDGELKKSDYRKFKIRRVITLPAHGRRRGIRDQSNHSSSPIDDTANLAEMVERRLKHLEWSLPNLIVVDGSKAQLNRVNKILTAHKLSIPVVGVVKDDKHKAREIIGNEEYKYSKEREIISVNAEVHRFAIAYHRKLRGKLV